MAPPMRLFRPGDRMPNIRSAAALIAGTGLVVAIVLTVPGARRTLEGALTGRWHSTHPGARRAQVALGNAHQPREIANGQEGPRASPALTPENDPQPETPPESGGGPAAVQASAAQDLARPATEVDPPSGPTLAQTDPDASRVREAISFYRHGDVSAGDVVASTASSPVARLTMEWAALRLQSHQVGLAREDAFAAAHPDWASLPWLKRRMEEALASQKSDAGSIDARLLAGPLKTVAGKLALARIERSRAQIAAASDVVRQIWREDDFSASQEVSILHEFGDLIEKADHKYRADRLLYKEQLVPALREAALAGPDVVLLAKARAAGIGNAASDAAIAAVPKPLQKDPGLTFSRIQKARRANKIDEAAYLMLSAPRDPTQIIDGDQWWVERRLVARKLLDLGNTRMAYRVVAESSATSTAMKIEAEFHAGWIALRFLEDPKRAAGHFARIAEIAETPISKSRAAYWQGRAAEASGNAPASLGFYGAAAQYSISFYGQLAAARIGRTAISLRSPPAAATGDQRCEAVRVAEYLFGLGERDIALPLALDVARYELSEAQVGAMATVVEQAHDAWATLAVGKAATQRGMALDETAFPTFGIPEFQPLHNSADLATVYAIARQESEFDPKSLSSAGAKGLMQMISSTAKRTAERAGVGYDDARLVNDAAFNAQLGAAHLGTLLDEQGGSYILTFAAYNAGGKNVKDWIDAYGDPRKPGVDPIDWIERIPFTETRNYVQRVIENLQIYRVRLGRPGTVVVGNDAPPLGKGT